MTGATLIYGGAGRFVAAPRRFQPPPPPRGHRIGFGVGAVAGAALICGGAADAARRF